MRGPPPKTRLGGVAGPELAEVRVKGDVVLKHEVAERAGVCRRSDMRPRLGMSEREPLLAVRLGEVGAVVGVEPQRVDTRVGAVADIRELRTTASACAGVQPRNIPSLATHLLLRPLALRVSLWPVYQHGGEQPRVERLAGSFYLARRRGFASASLSSCSGVAQGAGRGSNTTSTHPPRSRCAARSRRTSQRRRTAGWQTAGAQRAPRRTTRAPLRRRGRVS